MGVFSSRGLRILIWMSRLTTDRAEARDFVGEERRGLRSLSWGRSRFQTRWPRTSGSPDFSVTRIFYQGGALKCTIEYFYTHSLDKVSDGVYKMHGLLYDDEILEFDVHDESGVSGLRVGAMFLARRDETQRV